jgi:hypothetical protein
MTLGICNGLCNSADRICRILHVPAARFRIRLCLHSRQVPQPFVCESKAVRRILSGNVRLQADLCGAGTQGTNLGVTGVAQLPFLVTVTAIVGSNAQLPTSNFQLPTSKFLTPKNRTLEAEG